MVNSRTEHAQNPNFQHYLSFLITPEDTLPNNSEPNQQPTLTNNIPSTTSTKDETLAAIFLFELEKMTPVLLFSGAALDTKLITMMYTDAKVNGHSIKLILNSRLVGSIITRQLMNQLDYRVDRTVSTCIITADRTTKTLIDELSTWEWEEDNKRKRKKKEEENITEEATNTKEINNGWTNSYSIHEPLPQPPYIPLKCKDCEKKLSFMGAWVVSNKDYWTCTHYYSINCLNGYPHDEDKIWHIANVKVEEAMLSKILEIKNNLPRPIDIVLTPNPETFLDIETDPEEFHEYYQNLALTREE
ncbi:hypothetical protein G9A89_004788 [Geosiphon pyriformis]|nr:hypothetical protein G9A89_004788 [Geosiphon pyriformis]